ncbi:MAG: AtuA-related protein [Geminicoccaceae bacterium]
MKGTVQLRSIAHGRAGDKGDRSNVSIFALDARHFPAIKAQITVDRLTTEFPDLLKGHIQRYELDHLSGLNFVMDQALEGGVNGSLNLDSHGKSWSFLILGLMIDIEE